MLIVIHLCCLNILTLKSLLKLVKFEAPRDCFFVAKCRPPLLGREKNLSICLQTRF